MSSVKQKRLMVALGMMIILLGSLFLMGWQQRLVLIVQPHPAFVPLRADSALGLLFVGVATLGLAWQVWYVVRGCGLILLGLSLTVLTHWDAACGVPLERFWFQPSPNFLTTLPPLSPATSLSFLFFGISCLLSGSNSDERSARVMIREIAACSLLILTALGTCGHWTGYLTTGPATFFTRMAPGESVGLGLAGGVLLLCGLALPARGKTRWSVLAGMAFLTATLALWQGLGAQDHLRIERMIQFEASNIQKELQSRIHYHVTALAEFANEFKPGEDPDNPNLKPRAGSYIGQHPGCLAIGWVDPSMDPHWLESLHPMKPWVAALWTPEVRKHLEDLEQKNQSAIWLGTPRLGGGLTFLAIFVPLPTRQTEKVGVVAVFRTQESFDALLNSSVAPGYAIDLSHDQDLIYSRHGAERDFEKAWGRMLAVPVVDQTWQLKTWPTPEIMARERYSLPRLALGAGFLMAILLTVAVQLAQTARARARALEKEIAERHQAQAALQQSEAKYRCLIENLEHSVFLKDRDLRYVAVNKHYCQALGLSETELVGKTDDTLFPPDMAARRRTDDLAVLAEGKGLEREEQAPGEKPRTLRVIRTPVKDEKGCISGVLGIIWDVTEQQALEGHLRQAQKMEAIGQLAGGIAHDFNNLLTAILGNLSLYQQEYAGDCPGGELLTTAEQAATRAANLTRQLLGFSRQAIIRSEPTDLRTIVSEVVALLRRTIDPRINILIGPGDGLWLVAADPNQLGQVLMNLCINARDAMPEGGTLRLDVENTVLDEAYARYHLTARVGEFVRLRVSDTGHGIPHEVKSRIFEPFFTTKDPGKGTGLGLAMVFGIVQQHQGWIECNSEVNVGTQFDIYLPRKKVSTGSSVVAPPPTTTEGGHETILLADDEPMIRNLGSLILRRHGYVVLLAEDGEQAVQIHQREQGRIDLVILDLTMPRLSGRDAYRQIRASAPNLPVLFASGYSAEQITEDDGLGLTAFVGKPYRPDALARAVREILDRARESPPQLQQEMTATGL